MLQISVYSEFTFTCVIHGKVVVCNLSQLALIEKASIFLLTSELRLCFVTYQRLY